MQFEITSRDENDKPLYVNTFDGYAHIHRPFDEEQDGWMEDQLDPRDFEAVRIGRQMEALILEVNNLRRENFRLKKQTESRCGAY